MPAPSGPPIELVPLPWEVIAAVAGGSRLAGWADDFPAEGDHDISVLLHRLGQEAHGRDGVWGSFAVLEHAGSAGPTAPAGGPGESAGPAGPSEAVAPAGGSAEPVIVGTIGFFGPPVDGRTEVGYGIVASRQRRGYATAALRALVALAHAQDERPVLVATTDAGNVASQRVLTTVGFVLESVDDQHHYRLDPPA